MNHNDKLLLCVLLSGLGFGLIVTIAICVAEALGNNWAAKFDDTISARPNKNDPKGKIV